MPTAPHPDLAVVVPLRSFSGAKSRLGDVLTAAERTALTEELASGVLDALDGMAVVVVCGDDTVATWAADRGASVVVPDVAGLDAAAAAGVAAVRSLGASFTAIVHADLARPEALRPVLTTAAADPGTVTAVPDRVGDGTNVLVVPTTAPFDFAYGRASFERHRAEAARIGLAFRVVEHDDLGHDVDTPDDLDRYRRGRP